MRDEPLRTFAWEAILGADPGIFYWGWGGGGDPNFGSERTVELFCGKLLLTETTTCFSICESRSPVAREVLLCLKTITFF